jgi:hypothetical protein
MVGHSNFAAMKIIFLKIVLLLFPLASFAQSLPEHPKRMFQDEKSKRIYMNSSLAAYFFISTHPDGKDAIRMESENRPELANPMYFDGHGVHHFKHSDLADKVDIDFPIYADGGSPVSQLVYKDALPYKKNGKQYFAGNLSLDLSSRDELSGLEAIYYALDGNPYQKYISPLHFTQERAYVLKFYAVDRVGNVEKPQTVNFFLDNSPPESRHALSGEAIGNVFSPRIFIELSASDKISGIKYLYWKFDDQPERTYQGSIPLSVLAEGDHTLTYFAEDQVGNRETVHSLSFYLDKSPPVIRETVTGDWYEAGGKAFASARTRISLAATDERSGVKGIYFRINEGAFQEYTGEIAFPEKPGMAEIRAYAVDMVENANKSEYAGNSLKTAYLDLEGPRLSFRVNGPSFKFRDTVYIGPETRIWLAANDIESGVNRLSYRINQRGEEKLFETGLAFSESGFYWIDYFGYDNVNNKSEDHFHIRVDNAGPEIFPQFSMGPIGERILEGSSHKVYSSRMVIFLSAKDDASGYDRIYYSLNGGNETIYGQPIEGFKPGELNSLKIRALDRLKNEMTTEVRFVIED